MTPPKHIWSGNWETESEEDARRRAEAEAERRAHPQPVDEAPTVVRPAIAPAAPAAGAGPGTPPRSRAGRGRIAALAAARVPAPGGAALAPAGVLVLGGGAFAAGTLLDGSDGGNDKIARPAALPAVPSKPITPSRGQTRAGTIYKQAGPAVVSIRTGSGSCTGFLIDRQGTIVSNDHVVESDKTVQVKFGT